MEHDLRVGVRQKLAQRREVVACQRERIHEVHVVASEADLDDAEAGVVGPFPDKLGVECDGVLLSGAGAEGGEGVWRIDHSQMRVAGVVMSTGQPRISRHAPGCCARG